jgi:hypothetical protein
MSNKWKWRNWPANGVENDACGGKSSEKKKKDHFRPPPKKFETKTRSWHKKIFGLEREKIMSLNNSGIGHGDEDYSFNEFLTSNVLKCGFSLKCTSFYTSVLQLKYTVKKCTVINRTFQCHHVFTYAFVFLFRYFYRLLYNNALRLLNQKSMDLCPWEATSCSATQEFLNVDPGGSLPRSQDCATFYSEPDKSSPPTYAVLVVFPSGFPTKPCMHSSSLYVRYMSRSSHPHRLNILIIFGEEYKLSGPSLCNISQHPVILYLFPNTYKHYRDYKWCKMKFLHWRLHNYSK